MTHGANQDLKPLSQDEMNELNAHPLNRDSIESIREDAIHYAGILEHTPPNDPAYRMNKRFHDDCVRYIHLYERFAAAGVAKVVKK